MEALKKYKKQIYFHLVLNVLVALFISFSSYYHLPLFYFKDYFIYGIHFLILQFTIFGFLYFLSLNKTIFHIAFPILFFGASVTSFWIYTQDISISESLIQAVFEARLEIVLDVLSYQFILYFSALLFTVFLVVIYRKNLKNNNVKSPLTVAASLAVILFFYFNSIGFGSFKWRMPYNLYFGIIEYIGRPNSLLKPIGENLIANRGGVNIVFVLGESVRSQNMQLNGYRRNTNPLLKRNKNIVSFSNIYTPLTYTAVSVPQIVSSKSIFDTIKGNRYISLYSILNKINYKTSWIGNQSPERSYISHIEENDSINLIDFEHGVYSFSKKLDEELLIPFSKVIQDRNKNFITLHMIGSHWWYENRYSNKFRIFKPTLNSKYVPSQTKEQIINSYDNTIVYLDYFLNEVIEICKRKKEKTIIIYLSDHGEILGEDEKWLHAQNHKASTNPAMLVWYSNEFKESYPKLTNNLIQKSEQFLSTDFFYHSILDLLDISNIDYNESESIFYVEGEGIKKNH